MAIRPRLCCPRISRHFISDITSIAPSGSVDCMRLLPGPGSLSIGAELAAGDLVGPDADPVLARSGGHRLDRPEAHSSGGRTARVGDVVSDSLDQHAPSGTSVWIPAVYLEADICARCEPQFGAGGSAKDDHSFVEEVVDGKNERARLSVDQPDPAEVV